MPLKTSASTLPKINELKLIKPIFAQFNYFCFFISAIFQSNDLIINTSSSDNILRPWHITWTLKLMSVIVTGDFDISPKILGYHTESSYSVSLYKTRYIQSVVLSDS